MVVQFLENFKIYLFNICLLAYVIRPDSAKKIRQFLFSTRVINVILKILHCIYCNGVIAIIDTVLQWNILL